MEDMTIRGIEEIITREITKVIKKMMIGKRGIKETIGEVTKMIKKMTRETTR
jgi:hypothetical protein